MDELADRLEHAADALTAVSREAASLAASPRRGGLADDGAGLPGRVGRALSERWIAVLDARSHEASAAAARLGEMAGSVRQARRHYAATDEAVERRFTREM
jgi:hypothetical protein